MRSSALLFGILLIFVVSLATAGENEENQPAIYIKNLNSDLGTVFENDSYEFSFLVKNTGKADLVIESVKPG